MNEPHRILYLERKPVERQIIFKDKNAFLQFWNPYYQQILDKCWEGKYNPIRVDDYYIYETHNLNKDGSISKPHNAEHLRKLSPEQKAKQKQNWESYLTKKRLRSDEAKYRRELAELDFKIYYLKKQKKNLLNEFQEWKDNNEKTM